MSDEHDLVTALRALGDQIEIAAPAASDPVAAAVRRIAVVAAPPPGLAAPPAAAPVQGRPSGGGALPGARQVRGRHRSRRVALTVAALAIAVAVAVAVPGSRSALARLLGLGGVRVETTRDIPSGAAGVYDLGEPIAVDRALARASVPMVPDGLGEPSAAFAGRPDGGVTLTWAATGGLPDLDAAGTTGLGLIVTTFPGATGEPSMTKAVSPTTRVEAVMVGDRPGYWFSGAPHDVQVHGSPGSAGSPAADTVRLAGNTLVWTDGATTYRLESGLDRAGALALAERIPATRG